MSGHSKWHNIRVKKMATDAKRGKIYTRHARLIEIAARAGGDPTSNTALRAAIDNAKAENVPNDNIDRAIKKGTGALKGEQMAEVTYEAYGSGGAAFIISCLTDNKNRTLSNVKLILGKNGGRFAESGSVAWMFERKGLIVASGIPSEKLEEIELELIDLGADDFSFEGGHLEVITAMPQWTVVRDALKSKGFTIESAGLSYIPKDHFSVDAAVMERVMQLTDALEEDDDVSEVFTNAAAA
jgi:YebC/PmpR family DNA-binding regulatory protein